MKNNFLPINEKAFKKPIDAATLANGEKRFNKTMVLKSLYGKNFLLAHFPSF